MQLTKENIFELADRSTDRRPIVMPYPNDLVNEQLGRLATMEDRLTFAEKYGYTPFEDVYFSPLVNTAAQWSEQLKWEVDETDHELFIQQRRTLETPYGRLTEQTRRDKKTGLVHKTEEMIKTAADLKALAWIIKESVRVINERRQEIKEALLASIVPKVEQLRGRTLSVIHFWMPHLEVVYPHFTQVTMLYFMHDYPQLARELMDEAAQYTQFLVEIGTEADVDAMQTALWGYEQYSPAIYENYIIPYIKPISEMTQTSGRLFWNHTCGYMKELLESKMYHRFAVDILECLNGPPSGDVDDWLWGRRLVPEGTITKGNIEVGLLRKGPITEIKRATHKILVQSEGCKHILSTSDDILPGTPLAHFEAMMEAVDEYSAERGLS